MQAWLNSLNILREQIQKPQCPRVFISHRQTDIPHAKQIALEASQLKFDYWLDVIDLPVSKTAQVQRIELSLRRSLNLFEVNVLQAAIIEMALLNCTHVIAVMTKDTAGSQWVPYEYGRVDRHNGGLNAATAWCDTTTLPITDLPEYLHLAPIHQNMVEINTWLSKEMLAYPACKKCQSSELFGDVPHDLRSD